MPISDEELSDLFEDFKEEESESGVKYREEKKKYFKETLSEKNLSDLKEGDIREIVRKLWAFQMWTSKDYIVNGMLEGGLETLREELQEAIYQSSSKTEAYDLLNDNVDMLGPASASELLSCLFPHECGIWNKRSIKGLKALSYSDELPTQKGSQKAYKKFNRILGEIQERLEKLGHSLNDFLEMDYFLYYVGEEAEEDKTEEMRFTTDDFEHKEMKEMLLQIGDGLGFDVEKEYEAARGARIDVRWSTKIANLGKIAYAFEVQRRGSIEKAIVNLQKAKNADPSLQKLVIVSTKDQISDMESEIQALSESFRKFVSYLPVGKVFGALEYLRELQEILQEAGLMEMGEVKK